MSRLGITLRGLIVLVAVLALLQAANADFRPPENIIVQADFNMVDTVFRNLVSNALKFTNKGGKIFITVKVVDSTIEVSVKDTGVGIKPENVGKLFRVDQSYSTLGTEKEKGTGLGLVLCKEFIEKNKGKIWVKSKQGVGSEFYFTLPNISTEDFILQNLEEALVEAKKTLTKTSIMLMKIDNYDSLVNEFGYDSVTKIRNKVFNKVENDIAIGDFIHRFGDNNFVLQSNLTKQNMIVTVSRIKAIMDEIFNQYGENFSVEFSTGIAAYPDDGETSRGLWEGMTTWSAVSHTSSNSR